MRSVTAALLLLVTCALAQPVRGPATVGQWEVFEIEMTAARTLALPYVDGLPDSGVPIVRVVFTGVAGEAKGSRYTIAGFWDGGATWRARFAPPLPGTWSYASESADSGLAGIKGNLTATAWTETDKQSNPSRRGFVRVAAKGARAGRYFEYADGTPFLWIGDTWWNWSKRGIQFASFKKLADDRAAKGFTIGQIYLAGNAGMFERTEPAYTSPRLDQLRQVERFIAYANSRGITVWIHPWWSRANLNQTAGEPNMRRWWRYTIQRLGAYNVAWILAGEYNMNNYGGFGLQFWKDLGTMVRKEDPYGRMIGAHPTPPGWSGGAEAPQWSTGEVIHNEPWLAYNQSQVGHGKWRNEMIPQVIAADYARVPAKPTVVTEPWYEFIEGNPSAADVRFGAWSAILSGAAGHTYGGGHVWWANVPESPASQGNWPLEKGFERDTLDYAGAVSVGYMARFLKSIEWWTLEPHPELVTEYRDKFCAANPGKEYLVYLRYGGGAKVDLRPSSETDNFKFTWIDLTAGKEGRSGVVRGGAARQFQAPDDYPGTPQYKDWVAHIVKQ